jgi:hypothetical protein
MVALPLARCAHVRPARPAASCATHELRAPFCTLLRCRASWTFLNKQLFFHQLLCSPIHSTTHPAIAPMTSAYLIVLRSACLLVSRTCLPRTPTPHPWQLARAPASRICMQANPPRPPCTTPSSFDHTVYHEAHWPTLHHDSKALSRNLSRNKAAWLTISIYSALEADRARAATEDIVVAHPCTSSTSGMSTSDPLLYRRAYRAAESCSMTTPVAGVAMPCVIRHEPVGAASTLCSRPAQGRVDRCASPVC